MTITNYLIPVETNAIYANISVCFTCLVHQSMYISFWIMQDLIIFVYFGYFTDDHSRIVLNGNPKTDYINASYIDVRFELFILHCLWSYIFKHTFTNICKCK